jgi:hypothetical protein
VGPPYSRMGLGSSRITSCLCIDRATLRPKDSAVLVNHAQQLELVLVGDSIIDEVVAQDGAGLARTGVGRCHCRFVCAAVGAGAGASLSANRGSTGAFPGRGPGDYPPLAKARALLTLVPDASRELRSLI